MALKDITKWSFKLVKEVIDFFHKRAAACRSALASLARLQADKCFFEAHVPEKTDLFLFASADANSARLFRPEIQQNGDTKNAENTCNGL